jgi:hypothetical protein
MAIGRGGIRDSCSWFVLVETNPSRHEDRAWPMDFDVRKRPTECVLALLDERPPRCLDVLAAAGNLRFATHFRPDL